MNRRQFLKAATITTLYTAASPFAALAQGPFPFPLLEIIDNPALNVRAGLSSLGGIGRFIQRGQKVLICPTMRYLPAVTGHGQNTHPEIVRELIQQSLNAGASQVRVMDSPWANPERCARESGLRAVCDSFDPSMLIWPARSSDYTFLPLPKSAQGGVHIATVALDADAIILAPTTAPGMNNFEHQFIKRSLVSFVNLCQFDHASNFMPLWNVLQPFLAVRLGIVSAGVSNLYLQ